MATPYSGKGVFRAASGSDPLVPEPVSQEILQELPTQSAILNRARQVRLSTTTQRMPVLDVLPTAYFVSDTGSGKDSGLKATTNQAWKNVNLVVEEIAAIVPIPESYLADADVPIWDEVRPRLVEAIGGLIDSACFFGASKPATWGTDIYSAAVAAGNVINQTPDGSAGDDLAVSVAKMGEQLATDGFPLNGFVCRPGFTWKLTQLRGAGSGVPIYQPDLTGKPGGSLYGYRCDEVNNGSFDRTKAQLIAGDWTKAIVGLRQDISFKLFTEGVITDSNNAVILNLMQQDSVAMRVTMRLAFATANPVTALNSNAATRYPFSVLKSAGSGS